MFSQDVCQEFGHPLLYRVWVRINECTYPEDRRVALPDRLAVVWILSMWDVAVFRQSDKTILESQNTTSW